MKLCHDEIAVVPRASNAVEINCNGFVLKIHVAGKSVSISSNVDFQSRIPTEYAVKKCIELEMKIPQEAPDDSDA